jgi:hypothetical protein
MSAEQLVRSVAAITAVLYVVGFLTSNAYLYKLGVADFSLLRTRFVLTGALTLAPLMLALIMGVYAAVDASVFVGDMGRVKRSHLLLLGDVAIPFALYFVLFHVVAGNDLSTSARDAALLSVTCSLIVLTLLGCVAFYRQSNGRPMRRLFYRGERVAYERFTDRFGIPDALVENLLVVVGGVLVVLAYIGLFGQHFYPTIPEQLGGGRPRPAQVLVAAGAAPAARAIGLDVSEDAPLSSPVSLLWVGEDTYVIRLPPPHDRAVVQIARGLVVGIVTSGALTQEAASP